MFYYKIQLGDDMKTRLKDLREDRDIKQEEIAKILNITQAAYSNYELEKREMPYDILIKIALFYNVSLDYIFKISNKKEMNK